MINIVGLGAGSSEELTLQAIKIMKNGLKNFLRTDKVEAVQYFKENKIDFESFDKFYEEENSFDEVYLKIVKKLIDEKDCNYFVPGHPLVAEKTVKLLIESGIEINLVSGISFIEPVLNIVKRDISKGFILLDALDMTDLDINKKMDIIITQVYNKRILSEMKLILSDIYGDEYKVYLITDAGLESEIFEYTPIYLLDRKEVNHRSCIFIPKTYDFTINDLDKRLANIEVNKNLDEVSQEFLSVFTKIRSGIRKGYWTFDEILKNIDKMPKLT